MIGDGGKSDVFEGGWLSDNAGRIENISLAPNVKNAIYPLFEAVMNSIHAIEERFGPDGLAEGRIKITLHGDQQGEYTGFTVADNGIGFTSDNLTSLRKFDSRKKAKNSEDAAPVNDAEADGEDMFKQAGIAAE